LRDLARRAVLLKDFSSIERYRYHVMTMAFFRDDPNTSFEFTDYTPVPGNAPDITPRSEPVPVIAGKLRTPVIDGILARKWLTELMQRSVENAAATMIVGRAGTGKTALAAEFVRGRSDVSWYTIDAADGDWRVFQTYFRAVVLGESAGKRPGGKAAKVNFPNCDSPLDLFADVTAGLELQGENWPAIIVLDGIHHLFDQTWFGEFFDYLINSLPLGSHVVMLSRSKPPTPIWRLRSKQVLNVIDEKLLTFSLAEAEQLLAKYNARIDDVEAAVIESFGRVGGLIDKIGSKSARTS